MPPKKAYESYESESEGDSRPQKKKCHQGKKQRLDKNTDEYKNRRERNNIAVRKSREASRQKAKETMDKVSKLRDENKALEQKVTILNKELGVLKDLFLSHGAVTNGATTSSDNDSSTNTNSVSENVPGMESSTIEAVDLESEYFVQDHKYFVKTEHSS